MFFSLAAMLEAGIGVNTLPHLTFQEEHEKLRFIRFSSPRLEREIGLLQRAGQSLSPEGQAMQTFLLEQLR